ncbi:hypothetical protein FJZ22_01990 [Candidatus Pacearchaeota archaeon]|nr:hypothetical protein [Candidatus Pacearchaeota archaeon]
MHIWYGVNGEGMGHAMRSAESIRWLRLQGHTVQGYAGGKASEYLRSVTPTLKIPFLQWVVRQGTVSALQTGLFNFVQSPFLLFTFGRLLFRGIIHRPRLIITDFEPLTAWTAFVLRIPLISIDNQHSITDADSSALPSGMGKWSYQLFTRVMIPFPRRTLIYSFLSLRTLTPRATIVAPLVKTSVVKARVTRETHFLVYLNKSDDSLISLLHILPRYSFIVYGLNRDAQLQNVTLRSFNDASFIRDFASCRGFISNGGMTSLSEALYLHKPVLCIPLAGHHEQEANGHFLVQSGKGMMGKTLTPRLFQQFQQFVRNYRAPKHHEQLSAWKPVLQKTLTDLIS